MESGTTQRILAVYAALVVVFLALPELIIFVVSVNPTQRMVASFSAFSMRWYGELWRSDGLLNAFALSFILAPLVALVATTLGGLAAYGIARSGGRTKVGVSVLFTAPLVIPAAALGVALFMFMNMLGLTNTVTGVFIGHVVVALPYTFRTLLAAVEAVEPALEEAAESLGAGTFTRMRRVTLPLIRPGLAAAALFAMIVSLEEFTITLFIGTRQILTVPIELYNATEYGFSPVVAAASAVLMVASAVTIVVIERAIGLNAAYSLRK